MKNGDWPRGYHHLTGDERCQIHTLKESGDSNAAIARRLGCAPSTIGGELARNSGRRGYRFKQADRLATERRSAASGQPRKMILERWGEVEEKLAVEPGADLGAP